MKKLLVFILTFISYVGMAQDTITISEDLYLVKLSEKVYIHVSYTTSKEWGKFSSNGMIVTDNKAAFLFDTPMSDSVTKQLLHWMQDSMDLTIIGFIPNHWHNDCTEGMDLLKNLQIPTYANHLTNHYLAKNNLPVAAHTFQKSVTYTIGSTKITCNYLGAGHTPDNIVTWIPSEKILFGGCLVKAANSKSLGNIADADLNEWPKTIQKVLKKYGNAHTIIPGHGNFGTTELLTHTLHLLDQKKK